MKNKIIEYQLSKPEYREAANSIINTSNRFNVDSKSYNAFKKAGVLDLWFEPIYQKDIELNNWYVLPSGSIYFVTKVNGKHASGYGLDYQNTWVNSSFLCYITEIERKATNNEVKNVLIKEAIKRGLVEGVYIRSLWLCGDTSLKSITGNYHFSLTFQELRISTCYDSYILFSEGIWAEVVENKPEIVINGHKVILNDSTIEIGSITLSKYTIEIWYNSLEAINTYGITSIIYQDKLTISIKHMKLIVDYYKTK
jgi:hypothetical protein